jgi:hypothetical protein
MARASGSRGTGSILLRWEQARGEIMVEPKAGASSVPASADGVTERNPAIPASEEGTGMVPGDEGEGGADTRLPASEAYGIGENGARIEESGEAPAVSWPGRGGPGTIPPPG